MKKRYWIAFIVGLFLILISAVVVFAIDGTAVDWWVVAGGGAPSSADGITMNGTLGQPMVGQSSGGDVSLSAGYWGAGAEYTLYFPVVMR